jgi:hypothetical protein
MPAFRRFLAYTLPKCFGSNEDTLSMHGEAQLPNNRCSSGKKSNKKKKTLPDSLFATTIMKTIDTRVSSIEPEEDELQLVELRTNQSATGSNNGVHNELSETETGYKAQHQGTPPKD